MSRVIKRLVARPTDLFRMTRTGMSQKSVSDTLIQVLMNAFKMKIGEPCIRREVQAAWSAAAKLAANVQTLPETSRDAECRALSEADSAIRLPYPWAEAETGSKRRDLRVSFSSPKVNMNQDIDALVDDSKIPCDKSALNLILKSLKPLEDTLEKALRDL